MYPAMKVVDAVGSNVPKAVFVLRKIPAPIGYRKVRCLLGDGTPLSNAEVAENWLRSSLFAFAELVESLVTGNDSPQFSELDENDTLCAMGHACMAISAREELKDHFYRESWWQQDWEQWNKVFRRFIAWLPEEYRELVD